MAQGVFRPVLSGAGLVAVLVLAGCGAPDDDPPAPEPTASPVVVETPEPEPEPEPTIEEPQPTAAMDTADRAGAEAAAVYFLELYAYMFATGDTAEWERRSGDTCGFCTSALGEVKRVYDAGGRYEGVALNASPSAEVVDVEAEIGAFLVDVEFDIEGGVEHASDGTTVRNYGREAGRMTFDLSASGRGWVLIAGVTGDDS